MEKMVELRTAHERDTLLCLIALSPSTLLARVVYLLTAAQRKLPTYNFLIEILQKTKYLFQAAEDVNVTFEDQQKINKFARNTSRITELKEEIEVKKVLDAHICFRSLYCHP